MVVPSVEPDHTDTIASPRHPVSEWGSQWAATLTLLIILAVVGWWALPSTIQAGDAGEFATVMLRGGVPHPSGYPWMRMLAPIARAGELAGLPSATAAALPCALAGIVAWVWLHRLLCRLNMIWIAWIAVAIVGVSPIVTLHVNDSEVWGLLLLFATAVLAACLRRDRLGPFLGGFVLGLAMSHHLSAVLLAPLILGACWPSRPSVASLLGLVAPGLTGLVFGSLPYVTLMWGDGGAWRWGDTRQITGLWHHVTRSDYGVFSLSLHQGHPPLLDLLARTLTTTGRSLSVGLVEHPMAAAVFLTTLLALAWRQARGRIRPALGWGFLASLTASQVAFPLAHNIDPTSPFGAWILERFDILTLWFWTPILALALQWLWVRLPARGIRIVLAPALFSLLPFQLLETWHHGLPSSDRSIERYAHDVYATLPSHRIAVVIGTDDHRLFPLLFVDRVRESGGKAVYVDASLLSQAWYRREVRRRWSDLPEVTKPFDLIAALWNDPARRDIPIYFANLFSASATKMRRVPEGVLWRLIPPHESPETFSVEAVLARHSRALERYRGVVPSEEAGHPWSREVATHYVDGTHALEELLRARGRTDEADELRHRVQMLLGELGPGHGHEIDAETR